MRAPRAIRRHGSDSSWSLRRAVVLARWLGLVLTVVLVLPAPLLAESRLALVIGNSAYKTSPLANPANDAELIARSLAGAGFEVTRLVDADQEAMKRAVLDLGRRLRSGDSVGLLYYAGHAVQVDGENYLIPVDAQIEDAGEVPLAAVALSELLRTMERAQSRLTIAILDACRDNPFPAATRSIGRGLAPVKAPTGTLIAFATGPGEVALDGEGANSPYSAALAANIPLVGIPLEEVFRRTRRKVLETTAGRQTPWEHSSLTGEFFFRPKVAQPESSARSADPALDEPRFAEIRAWEAVKDTSDPDVLREHVIRFPGGVFAELAALKIEKLERQPAPWTWIFTGGLQTAAARSEAESAFERAVRLEVKGSGPGDLEQAASLYREAAERGLVEAMYRLGRMADHGRGMPRDLGEAAVWYGRAAEKEHAAAMAALGTMYEHGEGIDQDLVEALRLYRLAAERGDPHGMTALGYLYAEGKGVRRDAALARRWYGTAAELGHVRAMYNLALMHVRGQGGPVDLAQAVRLLQTAADKGHAGAMRELAFLFDEGRGVARNAARAAELLLAAYKSGHKEAAADLKSRSGNWSFATRREIQRRLAELGLYSGYTHGLFDRRTREALDRFLL